MTIRSKIITGLVLISAIIAGAISFTPSGPQAPEIRNFDGLIRQLDRDDDELLLTVDELEFLSGEEAIIKGMIDTGCARDEIADCIPSLNNDIYVRNVDDEVRVYRLSATAAMSVLGSPGSPRLSSSTLSQFEQQYHDTGLFMDKQPFRFRVAGDEITWLEEQYTP